MGTLIRSGERPAPRLSFSIGKRGECRACAIIDGVMCDHSSARTSSGLNNSSPRIGPGSLSTFCQTPIDEPFSFRLTHNANNPTTASQNHQRLMRQEIVNSEASMSR